MSLNANEHLINKKSLEQLSVTGDETKLNESWI